MYHLLLFVGIANAMFIIPKWFQFNTKIHSLFSKIPTKIDELVLCLQNMSHCSTIFLDNFINDNHAFSFYINKKYYMNNMVLAENTTTRFIDSINIVDDLYYDNHKIKKIFTFRQFLNNRFIDFQDENMNEIMLLLI
jgi:hypothetical protein